MMKKVETADTLYMEGNNSRESNRGSPSVEVYVNLKNWDFSFTAETWLLYATNCLEIKHTHTHTHIYIRP